jgi:hypothetical protein
MPNRRWWSAYRSRLVSPTLQRQGWLLWMDGAYPAASAASAVAFMVGSFTTGP